MSAETRYIIVDQDGFVENVVIGYVPLNGVGFIEQSPDLLHVAPGWFYDTEADAFMNPCPLHAGDIMTAPEAELP